MLVNLLIIFFLTILAWLAQYHWKRRRFYQIASKLDGPTPLPIIGSALLFSGFNLNILKVAMNLMETYKSPVPIWFGQRLFFGITDAEHLEIILNHPNAFQKEDLYRFTIPFVGFGLFTAPVPKWKKHRKLILPTFNQKILDGFVEIFTEQAIILGNQLKQFEGKGVFDCFEYFSLFTLDSVCETVMGISINIQTTEVDFVKWANKAMEIAFARIFFIWYQFDFIFNMTSISEEFKDCCEKLQTFTKAVIKQKREDYQQKLKDKTAGEDEFEDKAARKKNSFLQQFIELSEGGNHLTDNEIRDEVMTFTIAGSETTASVTSFILMMLGMHPDIQDKVYKEVTEVIGFDRPVEHSDLPKLPYTEMVIKETMRIFPVGPMIGRAITGDITLNENCVIPAGSSVVICIIKVHRDPKIWPNPLKFDPLRFLPEECAKRNPYSYLPFSGGPRNCLGFKYAMMAMKVAIATLIRKYQFKSGYERMEDIKIKQDLVMKPIDGYLISLERRKHLL